MEIKDLMSIAKSLADKKYELERQQLEKTISGELEEVQRAIEMVKSGLCYKKVVLDGGWITRYEFATEEMLINDYLTEPKHSYTRRGIIFQQFDAKKPWDRIFVVNGEDYYDMRHILQRYENDVIEERNRIIRYNDQLNEIISKFDELIKQYPLIKKMMEDWTARQKEAQE
jgi:hypothetical protein